MLDSLFRTVTILFICIAPVLFASETVELCKGSSVRFVSGDLAKTLLTQNDEYIRALSPMDIKTRCGHTHATKDEYLKTLENEVLEWKAFEIQRVKNSIKFYQPAMNALGLKLPKIIDIIKIKDGMYQGLAFTRLSFIVFSQSVFRVETFEKHIFPHEIFHVYSRYNRDISAELYQLIGFEDVGKLILSDDLASRKLNNPDYVHDFYSINIQVEEGDYEGETFRVFPVVRAKSNSLKSRQPFAFYYVNGYRLLVADKKGAHYVPRMVDGMPIFLEPKTTNFNEITQLNSAYSTGPEEIMAENFYFLLEELITKKRYASSPGILDKMKAVLLKHKTN